VKPASEAALPLLLKSLCLPTFAREYATVAVKAERDGLSLEGYLLALAEQEASERSERRIERLLPTRGVAPTVLRTLAQTRLVPVEGNSPPNRTTGWRPRHSGPVGSSRSSVSRRPG
jgi:hypothetical protein